MQILIIYLVIINAAALLLMLADKIKAKKKAWRIPERTLLLTAAFGGSLGAFLGMELFRHKTKHMAFALGIPAMLAVHIFLLVILLTKTA